MQICDSKGTPLPKSVNFDDDSLSYGGIVVGTSINTFHIAVEIAVRNGDEVDYDPKQKAAVLTTKDGDVSVVRHH